MTDRSKAERALAFLVHEIRDEWDEHGVASALHKCSDKPLSDVVAAALDCATRRHDQRTPACIALDGEHWRALGKLGGQASASPISALPYYDRSPTPAEQHPITDPAQIHAIRLAAKATTEGTQE